MSEEQMATTFLYFSSVLAQVLAIGFGLTLGSIQWRRQRLINERIDRAIQVSTSGIALSLSPVEILKAQAGDNTLSEGWTHEFLDHWVSEHRPDDWTDGEKYKDDSEFREVLSHIGQFIAESRVISELTKLDGSLAKQLRRSFISLTASITICLAGIPASHLLSASPCLFLLGLTVDAAFAVVTACLCYLSISHEILPAGGFNEMVTWHESFRKAIDQVVDKRIE